MQLDYLSTIDKLSGSYVMQNAAVKYLCANYIII